MLFWALYGSNVGTGGVDGGGGGPCDGVAGSSGGGGGGGPEDGDACCAAAAGQLKARSIETKRRVFRGSISTLDWIRFVIMGVAPARNA